MDVKEKQVVDYEYNYAGRFSMGEYAAVYDGQYYGYIDSNGNVVVSLDYDRVAEESFFSDNFGVVYEKDDNGTEKCIIVTAKGKKITINKCKNVNWSVGYKPIKSN